MTYKQKAKEGIHENLPNLDRTTTLIAGTTFSIASLSAYGGLEFSALGYNISELLASNMTTVAGVDMSYAPLVGLLSIMAVYVGNNADLTDFNNHQTVMGFVTLASVALTAVSPEFTSWLGESLARQRGFFILQIISLTGTAEAVELEDRYGHLKGGGN